ncbi:hypothetical protein CPB85DRAFT_271514 [Mucidula mucida]|nr:hypothetical protein CPB85DRAFT_271514 [Mucidula mucida]
MHGHQPNSDQQPLMTEIRTHQEEHPLVPNRLSHFVLAPNRPGQPSDYRAAPERSETQMTASTLVAEHGSELGRSDSFVTKISDAWARRRESPPRRRLLATQETASPAGSDDEWDDHDHDLGEQVTDRSQSLDSQPPGYWQSQATHSPIHGPLVDSSLHFNTPSSAHPGAQSSMHLAVYPSFREPTSTESPVWVRTHT